MMQQLQIDKGIPIPPAREKHQALLSALRRMEVGDSVFVEMTSTRLSGLVRSNSILRARKYAARKEASGCRVWRVE